LAKVIEVPASIEPEQEVAPPPAEVVIVQMVVLAPRYVPVMLMLREASQVEGTLGSAVKLSPANCS
jgi:hypothetical protein